MRSIKNLLLLVTVTSLLLAACNKVADLPFYAAGSNPVLKVSSTNIAPPPADSNTVALVLNWTDPKHATDSANYKYTIDIDSAGKNFSKSFQTVVMGERTASFTAKQLNSMLLAKGYAFNVPVDMEVRVTSSYGNNNERLSSNTILVKMTPYKIPPKVALPTSGKLFIVGSATQGGWNNPVPTPAQELHRINETTWGGIFQLNGGSEYLLLPVNGDWSNKYSVSNNTVPGLNLGGDFGFNNPDNFPGPGAAGFYKIIVDFQSGKFTVTPFTQQHGLPSQLFIVGSATPNGWNNPVPVPSQSFTRINSAVFELTLSLNQGSEYLLLPENGNWGKKFGVVNNAASNIALGSSFIPEGQNIPSPSPTGTYKITVNFLDNTYKLTP
jgi:starch-binding outer membrane protein SusE/F